MLRMLEEKNIIVTGSNRGIGEKMLEVFAENGANIFACARKKNEIFEEKIENLSKNNGVEIIPIYFDFEKEDEMVDALKKIKSARKKIDVLVNNAGVLSEYGLFSMTSIEKAQRLFNIDYFAQLKFTQYVLRMMQRNNDGNIIFISSIASLDAFFSSFDYAACKAAINNTTIQLAREVGEFGIRVNAIAPGVIETDMIKDVDMSSKDSLLPAIYLNRFGTREDVANVAMFLASDLSAYITGQIIRVDGGITPPRTKW